MALLAASGALSPLAAAAAFSAALILVAVAMRAALAGFAALRAAIDALAEGAAPSALRSRNPLAQELWHAVLRLARLSDERRRGDAAEQRTLEAMLAALPDPLFLVDERRAILRANPAAAALFGGALAGRDLSAALRHPAVLAAADAVLRGEAAMRVVEFALTLPAERQLSARIARLGAAGTGGVAAILAVQDLTAAKRSDQMRADFVANASHELRTPLATLLGFIETLRGPAEGDTAARARFLAIMAEQAGRMARLVDDLLSLSRIEMNEHVAPAGRADLGHIIGSVAATLQLRAKARGMAIALDLAPDLPAVLGEADELAQVFQNLIDNAIKYGREGTPIEVAARGVARPHGGPAIAVAIRDHGEGIAREHLPRLTERFYRVDTARSRAMGGTGLGLAIVKHIVNRHRGALEIESTPGAGSVFTILLRPAAAEPG